MVETWLALLFGMFCTLLGGAIGWYQCVLKSGAYIRWLCDDYEERIRLLKNTIEVNRKGFKNEKIS